MKRHMEKDTKAGEQNKRSIIARDGDCEQGRERGRKRREEEERGGKRETEGGKAGRKRRRKGLKMWRGVRSSG